MGLCLGSRIARVDGSALLNHRHMDVGLFTREGDGIRGDNGPIVSGEAASIIHLDGDGKAPCAVFDITSPLTS